MQKIWFPTHMINPYFNQNYSGINDQDLLDLDQWLQSLETQHQSEIFIQEPTGRETAHFRTNPTFGRPCSCIQLTFTLLK